MGGAVIRIHAHHVRAEFINDGLGVVDQRLVVVKRDDAHLIRREPERKIAGGTCNDLRGFLLEQHHVFDRAA
jgi:hypothetical protein